MRTSRFLVLIVNVDSRTRPVKMQMNCKNVMKKFFVLKKMHTFDQR